MVAARYHQLIIMRHLRRLGHCLVAGAWAGSFVAFLQLLLWPEVALTALGGLLAGAAWASWGALWIGGAAFLVVEIVALFEPHVAGRRGVDSVLLRWLALASGGLVAALALWNRERTRELLSSDRRQALVVVAAAALLGAALVAVTTRERWSHRRRVTVGCAGALLALVAGWSAWRAASIPSLPAEPTHLLFSPLQGRVLVVTVEGADLPWLLPVMERGVMPFLQGRRERGALGKVSTVRPFSRAAALTTLATGCRPAVHGVAGRRAWRLPWLSDQAATLLLSGPWPSPHHLPWRSWERAAPPLPRRAPLWEIVARAGGSVAVAGWPFPVEATWTVPAPLAADAPPLVATDASLRATLEPSLATHGRLAPPTRAAFAVASALVNETVERSRREPTQSLVLNLDLASRLRPLWTFPSEDGSSDQVLDAAARFIDDAIGRAWMVLGGEEVLLVVVSPYGLAPPTPWRRLTSGADNQAHWRVSPGGSPDGFVLFSGPGVRTSLRLRGVRLADVTATVLYLLDLPIARDMAGRVLLDAVEAERVATKPLRLTSSYPASVGVRHAETTGLPARR